MVGPVVDVSPKVSSRYTPPTFEGLMRGGDAFGRGLSAMGTRMREEKKAAEINAAMNSIFQNYQQTGQMSIPEGSNVWGTDAFGDIMGYVNQDQGRKFQREQFEWQKQKAAQEAAARAAAQGGANDFRREQFEWQKEKDARDYAFKVAQAGGQVPDVNWDVFQRPDGTTVTLDVKTQEGWAEAQREVAGGANFIGQTSATSGDMTSKTQSGLESDLLTMQSQADKLGVIVSGGVKPENLQEFNQFAAQGLAVLERAGVPLGEESQRVVYEQAGARARIANFNNEVISSFAGTAITEQEMERVMQELPGIDDSYSVFRAKANATIDTLEREMNRTGTKRHGDAWDSIKLQRIPEPENNREEGQTALGAMVSGVLSPSAEASPAPSAPAAPEAPSGIAEFFKNPSSLIQAPQEVIENIAANLSDLTDEQLEMFEGALWHRERNNPTPRKKEKRATQTDDWFLSP